MKNDPTKNENEVVLAEYATSSRKKTAGSLLRSTGPLLEMGAVTATTRSTELAVITANVVRNQAA